MRTPRLSPLLTALALLVLGAALTLPVPAHAFWGVLGKLGKVGGAAGKTAGTVGKGAAVGVAGAEGAAEVAGRGAAASASFADDAARTGFKGGAIEPSLVNAALPPEVAMYLAKPVKDLTPKDTAAMMASYQQMVLRAGRTGDFTALERASTGTRSTAPAAAAADSGTAALPFEAVRLLAHAASAGHRGAQQEFQKVCTSGTPAARPLSAQVRSSKAFSDLCADRSRRANSR